MSKSIKFPKKNLSNEIPGKPVGTQDKINELNKSNEKMQKELPDLIKSVMAGGNIAIMIRPLIDQDYGFTMNANLCYNNNDKMQEAYIHSKEICNYDKWKQSQKTNTIIDTREALVNVLEAAASLIKETINERFSK